MMNETYMKKLEAPKGKIDVVLDTDAFNEIDDQFAISYMLLSKEKLNCKAGIYTFEINSKISRNEFIEPA